MKPMTTVFTVLHVLAAGLFLGPVTVAVSTFHKYALEADHGSDRAKGTTRLLHSITRTYGIGSLLVPLMGFAVMVSDWATYKSYYLIHTGIVLSIIAWAVLFFLILPLQTKCIHQLGLAEAGSDPVDLSGFHLRAAAKRLPMLGGIFCALWFVTAILMFF